MEAPRTGSTLADSKTEVHEKHEGHEGNANHGTGLLRSVRDQSYKVTLVYIILAFIWIIASDQILERLFFPSGAHVITHWQTMKGTFFVAATALGLYIVAQRLIAPGERVRSVFQTVFESAGIGILVVSTDGRVLEVNPLATRLSGYAPAEVIGRPLEASCFPDDAPNLRNAFNAVAGDKRKDDHLVIRYVCKNGTILSLRVTLSRVHERAMALIIATIEDITAERITEDALRESEMRLRRFAEADLLGIAFCNQDGSIKHANRTYLRMIGYSQEDLTSGRLNCSEILAGDVVEHQRERGGRDDACARIEPFERDLVRKDGSRIRLLVGGAHFGDPNGDAVAYVLDISPLEEARRKGRELEEQLRQSHKLQALGQLAGAITHDMNNVLSIIIGHAALLEAAVAANNPIRNRTEQILRASEKGAGLIRQLLAFSRQQVLKKEPIEVNARVEAACSMLRPLLGENIDLTFGLDQNMPSIEADPVQLDQVLLNLVLNARDAMPNGGSVRVETSLLVGEGADPGNGSDGAEVCLSVADNGVGMNNAVKERLFEPFFTTKDSEKGTGLGLATVYGIVTQSGGRITVDSQVGKGSTFRIYFPVIASPNKRVVEIPKCSIAKTLSGTVLLAEDRPALRMLLKEVLQSMGFFVLECIDGQDAIEKASIFSDRIDLFVTDLGMPRVGGAEAAEVIRHKRPNTKVLYISGYVDKNTGTIGEMPDSAILLKPFTPNALAQKIRDLLMKDEVDTSRRFNSRRSA